MSHVHAFDIASTTYLIEPLVYSTTLGTSGAYTATINNYEIVENTVLFLKLHASCAAAATLSINSGTAYPIYYQGIPVTAGLLTANSTYILTFNSNFWHVLNNLANDTVTITIDTQGGLENGANGLRIKASGIINSMIDDGTIGNAKLANDSITIAGQSVALGGSLALSDLGLSNVLHFVGIAVNNTLANGSLLDPFSSALSPPNYSGSSGDVVIYDTGTDIQEYIWINSSEGWELLGSNLTYKTIQTPVSDPNASGATDAFIDSISQNANGDITVSKKYVSGWQYARTVYVDLTTDSTATTINGGAQNAAAIPLGIHGILGVNNGGTGADESNWQQGGIVYGKLDNNTKQYASVAGLAHQILISGGTGAPVWATAALLESIVNTTLNANNYTTLELGNDQAKDSTSGHSEGRIVLYSANTEAHLLYGAPTDTGYTHTLPNANGYLLQAASTAAVGSNTQPVYFAANGIATALTYTPNRLYYSDSAVNGETYAINFVAGDHYADSTKIGINITTWPSNNTDTLYVNGNTSITGILNITDTTDITNATNGALIVAGGAYFAKKVQIHDATILNNTLTVDGRVGIGTAPDSATSGDQHALVVNGSILIVNSSTNIAHLDINTLRFYPETNNSGSLGLGGAAPQRWGALFLGSSDTYGDAYQPVYWSLSGIPAVTYPVQYTLWTINSGHTKVTFTGNGIFTTDSYVIALVVTEGFENLNGPLIWTTGTNSLVISTIATSGAVSGYVLTARGVPTGLTGVSSADTN